MNSKILPFEMKNIPQILDVVVPLWSPPAWDDEFRRFNVEYIVRNNIFENDLRYELVDFAENESDGEFCSCAFFTKKGGVCKALEWYERESKKFPEELRASSKMSRTYIEYMDEKTQSLMNKDDIQLTLYVSRKPGAGSRLLNELCARLKNSGIKICIFGQILNVTGNGTLITDTNLWKREFTSSLAVMMKTSRFLFFEKPCSLVIAYYR